MSSRKDLKPGDLVCAVSQRRDTGATVFEYAIVIGVDYFRESSGHMGCEERVRVMWSDPVRFELVCDCGLEPVESFLTVNKKKCVDGEKSVKQAA